MLFHGRFPGEKAAAIFAAKSAEAFAAEGVETAVLVPRRLARAKESPKNYYDLSVDFKTVYVPTLDLFSVPVFKRVAFSVSYGFFSAFSLGVLLLSAQRNDIIYSNEALPLLLASFFFSKTVYEVHDLPKRSFMNRTLFSRVCAVIATNRWKRNELIERFGLSSLKLFSEPNAVDVEAFSKTTGSLREKFAVSTGSILVGYVGALSTMGMEKGITTLLHALSLLPPRFHLLIVGGSTDEIKAYRDTCRDLHISGRVQFAGWIPHGQIPECLAVCDVLVAPFPKTEHYNHYMSPMKVFEYMAAGKPIVATRLQSIEEIVDDTSAYLVAPSDPKALSEGINAAATDPAAKERIETARLKVQEHTWQKRADRILGFINGKQ